MNARSFALISLSLLGCTAAPPLPAPQLIHLATPNAVEAREAPAPATAPPPRISLADVVRRAAPDAHKALVISASPKQVIADLARVGISASAYAWGETCLADPDVPHDVVVVDTDGPAPWFCFQEPHDRALMVVRSPASAAKETPHRTFIDARCERGPGGAPRPSGAAGPECDAFTIEAASPARWFVAGDLPLVPLHPSLTRATGAKDFTAFGVLVTTPDHRLAIDLEGDPFYGATRLLLDGGDTLAGAATRTTATGKGVLAGWVPEKAVEFLPRTTSPALVRVTGSVHLEGHLGLATLHFFPWKRPTDAPAIFAPLSTNGTLATMIVTRIDNVVDAPTLARLDGDDDAALRKAALKIATGDVASANTTLRATHGAMKSAVGADVGRAAFLATTTSGLTATESSSERPYALARTFLKAKSVEATPAQRVLLHALYVRAVDELTPLANGNDPRAVRAIWKLLVQGQESPLPIHGELYRRTGEAEMVNDNIEPL